MNTLLSPCLSFYKQMLFFVVFVTAAFALKAQAPAGTSSANYIFNTIDQSNDVGSNSFTRDLIGITYSMPGTVLRSANKQNENSGYYLQPCYPNPSCSYAPIGFDFYFMGTWAREFIINTEGIFGLPAYANGSINSEVNGGCKRIGEVDQTPTGAETRIAPFTGWYARTAPNTGQVSYKTIGFAPFRTLVVEWKDIDFRNYPANPGTDLSTFQLRLYETTNKIDFVYGSMRVGTAGSYQAGFSFGTEDGQMATIENLNGNNPVVNTQSPASSTNIMMNPVIALHSPDGDGKRREFVFDPYTGTSNTGPTDLQAVNAAGGAELSWTDAPNEIAYDIYWSTNPVVPPDFTSGHAVVEAGTTDYTIGTFNVSPVANLIQGSNQISFGNIPLRNVWVGASISGNGLAAGTRVTSINFAENTISISDPAESTGQMQLSTELNPQTQHYFKVYARREALSAPAVAEIFTGNCISPDAAFSFEAIGGYSVQFSNLTTGSGSSSVWDFGDGNSSLENAPEHTFPGPGNYPVKLVVSNSCGKDSVIIQVLLEPLDLKQSPAEKIFWYDQLSGIIHFEATSGFFEIWGIDGKFIQRSAYSAGESYSLQTYMPGVYILRMNNEHSGLLLINR